MGLAGEPESVIRTRPPGFRSSYFPFTRYPVSPGGDWSAAFWIVLNGCVAERPLPESEPVNALT